MVGCIAVLLRNIGVHLFGCYAAVTDVIKILIDRSDEMDMIMADAERANEVRVGGDVTVSAKLCNDCIRYVVAMIFRTRYRVIRGRRCSICARIERPTASVRRWPWIRFLRAQFVDAVAEYE